MPYNLRPRNPRKNRSKAQKPPPADSSDDSSDDGDVVVVQEPVVESATNPKKQSKSKKSYHKQHKSQANKQQVNKDKKQKENTSDKTAPRNSRGETTESPLERVISRLMSTYAKHEDPKKKRSDMGFIVGEDSDDESDEYHPGDSDDEEEEEYVVLGGGMTLGDMMGMTKRDPYDISLPPKKLTPELLEYLQNMPNILGKAPKPGEDIDAFRKLPKDRQATIVKSVKKVANVMDNEEHPYFRILSLPIDANSKRTAIERQIAIMDAENSRMGGDTNPKAQAWVRGFLSIPFGKYQYPVKRAKKDPAGYLRWSMDAMNKIVYGMDDAKDHILRYVAQMITNPRAAGNCLAFLGPPGTGKTSLIRNGLGKILNRPVHMIALGGNTDASVLEGHGYTYEGSVWGQIVDILIRSKCMNPVIIFDELDKVSGTSKGDEIVGLLTHITDSTQNTAFQDKYFAGINIDLSRVLFVFTLNDENSVNPILADRLRMIRTEGYSTKEKRIIGENHLLPHLLKDYAIPNLKLSDPAWNSVLKERKEDGVRNLKRDLETIVSRLNLLQLFRKNVNHPKQKHPDATTPSSPSSTSSDPEKDLPKGVPRGIQWQIGKDVSEEDVEILLGDRNKRSTNIPFGMYC